MKTSLYNSRYFCQFIDRQKLTVLQMDSTTVDISVSLQTVFWTSFSISLYNSRYFCQFIDARIMDGERQLYNSRYFCQFIDLMRYSKLLQSLQQQIFLSVYRPVPGMGPSSSSTTVDISVSLQTSARWRMHCNSTTVDISVSLQTTFAAKSMVRLYNSRYFCQFIDIANH